ncbi:universal stress protein [Lacisediminihabitans sp.]|uniref:universal stress protein n=1 Tax=Lacisediminihabitans sp. TaxID=2787631 RepID=UPI00374DC6A0
MVTHEGRHDVIEKTVVGWDGTASARAAVDWAVERGVGKELHLVQASDEHIAASEFFAANSPAAAARIALMEDADRIREAYPAIAIESELVQGDPAEELGRYSSSTTLIVVGAPAKASPSFRYNWSVGSRLAASARGPVAIVPADGGEGSGIVVGVDGSPSSHGALTFAAEEALRRSESLRVVHAWLEPAVWQDVYVPDDDFLESLETMHRHVLDEALATVARDYPGVSVEHFLARGRAQDVLGEAARGASLLVVGNHGLHGIRRLLLGSVSHALVLGITTPLVVVGAVASLG